MTYRCNYCGREKTEYDEEICGECGGEFVYDHECIVLYSWEKDSIMANYEGDLFDGEYNNVDAILEWKRSNRKIHSK